MNGIPFERCHLIASKAIYLSTNVLKEKKNFFLLNSYLPAWKFCFLFIKKFPSFLFHKKSASLLPNQTLKLSISVFGTCFPLLSLRLKSFDSRPPPPPPQLLIITETTDRRGMQKSRWLQWKWGTHRNWFPISVWKYLAQVQGLVRYKCKFILKNNKGGRIPKKRR